MDKKRKNNSRPTLTRRDRIIKLGEALKQYQVLKEEHERRIVPSEDISLLPETAQIVLDNNFNHRAELKMISHRLEKKLFEIWQSEPSSDNDNETTPDLLQPAVRAKSNENENLDRAGPSNQLQNLEEKTNSMMVVDPEESGNKDA